MELADLLARVCQASSDDEAVVCGQVRLRRAQLGHRVERLAAGLAELGLRAGTRVAILEKNCHRYVEAQLAAAWSGVVLVPLNHRLAPGELHEVLADSEARALLLGPTFLQLLDALRQDLDCLEHVIVMADTAPPGAIAYEHLIRDAADSVRPAIRSADELLYLYYTSGTTGRPKGVMLTAGNIMFNVETACASLQLTSADRYLHTLPLFHRAGSWAVLATLVAGGCVCLTEFNAEGWLESMRTERISVAALVPTMVNLVLNSANARKDVDLSNWRLLVYGASPMPAAIIQQVIRRFGVGLLQSYGMTEANPGTYLLPVDHASGGSERGSQRIRSVGRPVRGVELRVVDEQDRDLPVGAVGEVAMRGPNVMRGYWKQPAATAQALRGGWMHTGDMGSLDQDGYLYLVDRKKDMIISGGENVYSTEVEAVLYQHPAILEAAVIGVPDPTWGETVKAIVVLKTDQHVTAEELRAFCRERIAGYKLPRSVDFVERLPKTASGKISKQDLRAPYWAAQSDQSSLTYAVQAD
jgi:long-chain acyl-CoA synthetase